VTIDGALWAWGWNHEGQLAQGNTTDYSSPVQVGALTDWSTKIGGGQTHFIVLKTDGTVWCWGYNGSGQLGQGDTTSRSSPVQVGALTTWAQIGGGENFCLAIKTDGTLWAWGQNNSGQLGQGNTTDTSSPVQVGALTTWALAGNAGAHNSSAVKTDGTLWTWGYGAYGSNGDGTTTSRSSPVQVGALTDWATPIGGTQFMAALKTDGTLWTWGSGADGRLGHGNVTTLSSPAQVGALTTWSGGVGGNNFMTAFKTDGTLWAWGSSYHGQLGDGTTVSKSSPIQIGALTTWAGISNALPVASFSAGLQRP
jgi:alpha-tubulin suppressor-like RCC1 family protein